MEVRFVLLSTAGQKRAVTVRLPILVGRSEDAKFRIEKDSVSRRHCEFFLEDDVVFVRDLGSTNGTLIENEEAPANVATRVPPGATVRIGGVAFRVEYEPAAAPQSEDASDQDTVPLPDEPNGADADEPAPTMEAQASSGDVPATEAPAAGLAWMPEAEAAPPPVDDDNLNDFFKSLS